MVDIVEFAEKFMKVELNEWQKRVIRTLDEMGKDAKICCIIPRHMGRDNAVYIYMNAKELIHDGKTDDSKR
jgi:hypothetical protein